MTRWIGDAFASTTSMDLLETLVDVSPRLAGSEGERNGAEATRDVLASVGARNAHLSEYDIQGWTRGSSRVVAGGDEQDCIALPRSPSDEATAELVDVGYGTPEEYEAADVDGKVVMARSDVPSHHDRYIHRREKYYYAVEGGAVAFIYRNHVEGQLPPTGSVGTNDDPIGDIPAVGVSSEVGARLARRYDGEEVTVEVDAEVHDATSRNVHAELGPDTDEQVLVTSHVDAHDIAEGAMDNGAGTAVLVGIAEALAAREDELDTRVHFIAYGSEEVGLVGSSHYADRTDHDAIKAIVNNDGVGRARDLQLLTHGFPELEDAAATVSERFDHPIHAVPRQGPHSDHWPFVKWGVPGYHASSASGEQGRGWGHTHADTLDKVDSRDLRTHSILLADLTVELAADGFEVAHRAPEEIARALEQQNKAEGMKVIGDWPYDDE